MNTEAATPNILFKAITCIHQMENMLGYLIQHMNDDDETKDVLIVTKQFAKSYVEEIERELQK
ncbi:hypothetical protein [Halodesulfovibrio spirochaetisodalis]|uniref:Uncharacterized protein n=1 Tax=Halodesulfovibrio spirochaetisodalis TaxID=1560234 RepID=A0A1B7XDQ0_9BACT|nr:hypothetical protein [Halodesulfovibrio spirochaetisodalis]OBQ52124.1 hypothetical protein SP90_08060 [Halodesulfovibrio spirochaetisodalis]